MLVHLWTASMHHFGDASELDGPADVPRFCVTRDAALQGDGAVVMLETGAAGHPCEQQAITMSSLA